MGGEHGTVKETGSAAGYLLFSGQYHLCHDTTAEQAEAAMSHFATMRSNAAIGVQVPSQRRSVHAFARLLEWIRARQQPRSLLVDSTSMSPSVIAHPRRPFANVALPRPIPLLLKFVVLNRMPSMDSTRESCTPVLKLC